MHTLACSSSLIVVLLAACSGGEGDSGGGETVAASGSSGGSGSESGGSSAGPGTDATGDTGTSGPMSGSSGSTSTDTGPVDSSGSESGGTSAGGPPGDWLLTVDNGSNPPRLMRVDLGGGVTEICSLAGSVNYSSLVFTRDGELYANNAAANRIDVVNPCNCSFQIVGPTSLGPLALGLAAPGDEGLYALDSALDAFVQVDLDTGLATVVGSLGFTPEDWSIAWSDAIGQPYAVEGTNDFLYTVTVVTGEAVPLMPITADVANPGFAVHPNDDGLYVCSGNTLYSLDPMTGLMLPIGGGLGLAGACQTLAAPQLALDCIDSL